MEESNNNSIIHSGSGGIKEMLAIALPMVVSNSCETVMVFTDRLFMSKLGMEQMNATMSGGISAFFTITFFIGLLGYATAMIGQYLGKGEPENCSKVLTQIVILSFLVYPVLLLIIKPMHMLFEATGISPSQLEHQKAYFNIIMYGSIISLLRISLSNFFSGIGRTRIVMFASFCAMFVNVFASYVFIFGKFGFEPMGIVGAAYGFITGNVFSMSVLALGYFRKSIMRDFSISESFVFRKDIIKNVFRFGTPSGIEFSLMMLSFTLMIAILQAHGPVTATASTIMFNWDHVAFVPLVGLEIGVTSLVGRYVGAKRYDIVKKTTFSGVKIGSCVSIFILVAFVFFPGILSDVFKPEGGSELYDQARPLAISMIRLASLYVMLASVMLVYMGALKGAGDTLWSMIINVSYNWIILAVLYMSLYTFDLGAFNSWMIAVIIFVFLPVILFIRFMSGRWQKLNVV
jgi:MATE family multidrug resistance protein